MIEYLIFLYILFSFWYRYWYSIEYLYLSLTNFPDLFHADSIFLPLDTNIWYSIKYWYESLMIYLTCSMLIHFF